MKINAEFLNQAQTYWRGLAPRERLMLSVGGVLLGIVLLYSLLWAPLQRDLNRLRAEVPRGQQQLQWMRSQAGRVQQLRAAAPAVAQGGSLMSFVEQSSKAYNIRANIQPEGQNAVRVGVDGVGFNSLAEWLANLQKQGGVRIENATLEPQPTSGVVNARLLLRAGS